MLCSRIILFFSACLLILFFVCTAATAEMTVEFITLTGVGGQIVYPQINGLDDPVVCDQINKTIIESGQIIEHAATLSSITSAGGKGINVDSEYSIHRGRQGNDVLSVLLTATGKMPGGRIGHIRTPLNFLLSTGERLTSTDIFLDIQDTGDYLDQYVSSFIIPDLSSYMENSCLVPVPMESFYLADSGIMFCYDSEDFALLSGDSGAIELAYFELKDYLDLSESGVPAQIRVNDWFQVSPDTAAMIAADIEDGMFQGLSIRIGEPLQNIIQEYKLLYDPDYYPGGMYFQLEDARCRGVRVFSDEQTDDYTALTVSAIRTGRFNLYGLVTGTSTQHEWRDALGAPDTAALIDNNTAGEYGVPEGCSDSYRFGWHVLTLFANAEGTLAMLQLESLGMR